MVTGCAPFFLLGLLGVALGSWFFGSHLMARVTGLLILAIFLTYFALLNWTAQINLRNREEQDGETSPDTQSSGSLHLDRDKRIPFTGEDRREWAHYLRTEGRLLWLGVFILVIVLIILIARG